MRNKYRPPYVFLLLFFIFIIFCLMYVCAVFIRSYFLESLQAFVLYNVVFGGLCVMAGSVWVSSAKDWNMEEFAEGLNTVRKCKQLISLIEIRMEEIKKGKVE